ncbi:DNA helicase RecQ [Marispirochaeta aestuarii]|uniref:DNA helicase RecQ n=1 Tax=Marispirochaeta aestuarii TaxID=1963862 RepID=UPI002ABE7AE3|nr:DNA helicase RecQ [Marispirochaeta aestuarii]
MMGSTTEAKKIAKRVFGFDSFRPLQKEIIGSVLAGRDTLVVMPTGGGKSLCYQIPALVLDGLTLVVSPLISLMEDQVSQLKELGVPAVCLNSSLSAEEYRQNMGLLGRGEIKLLYTAPETLLQERTAGFLEQLDISCIAIDEAHCISEWGHDFRPEYRQIAALRTRFPKSVWIALTATATEQVRRDICSSLNLIRPEVFVAGFDRPGLFLEVRLKSEPDSQMLDFIRQYPDQSGIIYCATRRRVDETASMLRSRGFLALPYHAGLSDEERRSNQRAFIKDDVQIMVATVAFGMGIDKPDIRFILHRDLPKNIESYYQQIGRAGRDGLDSHCLLLFGYGDIRTIRYFISGKDKKGQKAAELHLKAMINFAESEICRRVPLLSYFGEAFPGDNCRHCDNCSREKKQTESQDNISLAARKFLSCVVRTGRIFGAGHIIDVLRGSKSQKILDRGHDSLSTYGIGLEYTKRQWFHLSRQFIRQGLLTQDPQHGSLLPTEKARQVLRGELEVFGELHEDGIHTDRIKSHPEEHDSQLFEVLRGLRKRLADQAGLPPYIIFPDTSLLAMASRLPQNSDQMLDIPGVGEVKLAKYGSHFLRAIAEYSGM